jgi:hypothetical protein
MRRIHLAGIWEGLGSLRIFLLLSDKERGSGPRGTPLASHLSVRLSTTCASIVQSVYLEDTGSREVIKSYAPLYFSTCGIFIKIIKQIVDAIEGDLIRALSFLHNRRKRILPGSPSQPIEIAPIGSATHHQGRREVVDKWFWQNATGGNGCDFDLNFLNLSAK